ncbi:TPA: hypothetical protein ACJIWU_003082 [Enterobacter chengduensis]|nr:MULTISPECIES: hypothetical protein [Enterobacter cloacae complex]MDI6557189.1 hypothetical protein [Enterobacter chengduensis]
MTTGRAVRRPAEQILSQGMISLKVEPVCWHYLAVSLLSDAEK